MKKLMIAAAAAAMVGGAFASNCTPDTPSTDCATVYTVSMSVKTTKGVAMSSSTSGSQCTPGTTGCWVARVSDSTKFTGYIYDCSCVCDVISTGSVTLQDSKRKVAFQAPAFTTTFIHVMGKKQADAEWAWSLATGDAAYDDTRVQSYTLAGSGIGKYDTKNSRYSSFSGYFAGTATGSYDLTTKVSKNACACDPSTVWACTDLATDVVGEDTVAYGTWSIKYSSSKSKQYLKDGTL